MHITKQLIDSLLEGYWYRGPNEGWYATHLSIAPQGFEDGRSLYIALDEETWDEGTRNTGVYAGRRDTHPAVKDYIGLIAGVVVRHPLEALDPSVPQFVMDFTYDAIVKLGAHSREVYGGKIVAVTGTVGKSTTKQMLGDLLSMNKPTIATLGNTNSRTGVRLTLSRAQQDTEYLVLEVAVSAIWTREPFIAQLLKPDVAVITQVGVGQGGHSARKMTEYKTNIAKFVKEGGAVVINRNIETYDYAVSILKGYTRNIVTYGFHPDADVRIKNDEYTELGSTFDLVFPNGTCLSFVIKQLDKGTISNIAASLATMYCLGEPISEAHVRYLQGIEKKKSDLDIVPLRFHDGRATLIDDSYNAQHLSMLNAFELFRSLTKTAKARKIAIIGRIVNLADASRAVHASLAQPLLDAGVDVVIGHGQDTRYLLEQLPKEMRGGVFSTAMHCAYVASKYIEDGSYILLKGSRRSSDLPEIRRWLVERLDDLKEHPLTKNYGKVVGTKVERGAPFATSTNGIGAAIVILHTLMQLATKKITLRDVVTVPRSAARDRNAPRSVQLNEGEQITLFKLIQYAVQLNAPDSILALAEHVFGSNERAVKGIQRYGRQLGLSEHCTQNISGRRVPQKIQYTTVSDLERVAEAFLKLPKDVIGLLTPTVVERNGAVYEPKTALHTYGKIVGFVGWGPNYGTGIALFELDSKLHSAFVIEAADSFARDALLFSMIDELQYGPFEERKLPVQEISGPIINVLGDTYFGEAYTRRRQKRGIDDALTKRGYGYSFERVGSLFSRREYNILNFEAVFTVDEVSDLQYIKDFILDANGDESSKEIKARNFRAVTLANNHLMDFGEGALIRTVDQFSGEDIVSLGAGENEKQASTPLILNYGGQEVAVFNGYWYRNSAYKRYSFYALGNKPGVNCIAERFYESILDHRLESPESIIVAIAHWGVDYQTVDPLQREHGREILKAGADIVIGHGPHTIQQIEWIDNKPLIYSIGNAVFNSNGEYNRYQAPPYGMVAKLDVEKRVVRLFPIFTNNEETFWQPYVVESKEEFRSFLSAHKRLGTDFQRISVSEEGAPPYISLSF